MERQNCDVLQSLMKLWHLIVKLFFPMEYFKHSACNLKKCQVFYILDPCLSLILVSFLHNLWSHPRIKCAILTVAECCGTNTVTQAPTTMPRA